MISHKRTIPPNLWNVVVDVEGSAAWCQQTSTADGHFQGTISGWHSQSMWSLMYRNVSSWNFLSIRAHKFICLVHLCIYIHCHIYMYIVYIIIIYMCVFIMYCIWNLIYSRVCLPNMNFISPWSDSPGDSVLSGVIGGESTAWLVRPGAGDANDLRWFFINGVVGKFIVHPQKNRTVIQALLYRNSVLFWKGSMKIFQSSILGFYMFWIVFGVWSWGKTGGQTMRNKWAVRCFFYLSG